MRDGTFHGHPDHDACGTGLIVRLGQPASHEVVDRGLVALQRLAHRGGVDADGASGDGAGLLTGIPQRFIRRRAEELGIRLPRVFAMGMVFLPIDEVEQAGIQRELERMAQDHGLKWLGWRKVPVNHSVLGLRAAETWRPPPRSPWERNFCGLRRPISSSTVGISAARCVYAAPPMWWSPHVS